jgi:hypothetical protein
MFKKSIGVPIPVKFLRFSTPPTNSAADSQPSSLITSIKD